MATTNATTHTGEKVEPVLDDHIHEPEDKFENTGRNPYTRVLSSIATIIILELAFGGFLRFWGMPYHWIGVLSIPFLGYVLWACRHRMLTQIPQWHARVNQNDLWKTTKIEGGKEKEDGRGEKVKTSSVIYGPNLHPRHWWENEGALISLEVKTHTFDFTVTTKSGDVMMSGSYTYAPQLDRLDQAIGTSDAEFVTKFDEGISGKLNELCGPETSDSDKLKLAQVNESLRLAYYDRAQPDFESPSEKYGRKLGSLVVNRIAPPEAVQESNEAELQMAALRKAAVAYAGGDELFNKLPHKAQLELLDKVMVARKLATMTVFKGDPSGVIAAGLLASATRGKNK